MNEDRYKRGWEKLKEVDREAGEHVIENLKDIAPELEGNPIDILNALMEEHGLKQSDLYYGIISEILSGKSQLNVRQI
jgi:antitoxin component HigA of HigAB toxin-antitoxin module